MSTFVDGRLLMDSVCVRKEWRHQPNQPEIGKNMMFITMWVVFFLEIQHSFGIRQCLKGEGHFTIAKIDSHG